MLPISIETHMPYTIILTGEITINYLTFCKLLLLFNKSTFIWHRSFQGFTDFIQPLLQLVIRLIIGQPVKR